MKDLKTVNMNGELSIKRILAIDYGKKRIGLALSDPMLIFSYSFKTFENNKHFYSLLENIIIEKGITKIILGYPTREDGKESILIKEIKQFKNKIENRTKLEVEFWDEIYTSKIAEQRIVSSINKKKKRRRKELIDSGAAAIILQEYLDKDN